MRSAYHGDVSDTVDSQDGAPHGTALLTADLSDTQLEAAPVLASVDVFLIDSTDDEDDAFAAALDS